LTRNAANTPKPQLNATTEAATAAIIRRKLGNIAPRNEGPARDSQKHESQRARDHREGEGFSVDDSPLIDASLKAAGSGPPNQAGATLA
jgi:hypothetical protein